MMHWLRKFDADKLTRSRKEWRPSRKWSTAQDQTCLPDLQRMSKELWKNCSAHSSNYSKYYFMQFLRLIDLCSKKAWHSQTEMISEWLMIHAFISQATWTSWVLIKLFVPLEMLSHGGVWNSSLFCARARPKCERLKLDERTAWCQLTKITLHQCVGLSDISVAISFLFI